MSQCIIVYDDGDAILLPMQWDDDCEGAVHAAYTGSPFAVFPDAKVARKAIAVSKAWNRLLKEQGKICSDDFIDPKCLKRIRIVKLVGGAS